MSKTIHRIMLLIKHLGISARQFDISIGTANGYILRMEKNNASVGSDIIERIIKLYPQVNLIWLITGNGEMLNEESPYKKFDAETYINERLQKKLTIEKRILLEEVLDEIKNASNH